MPNRDISRETRSALLATASAIVVCICDMLVPLGVAVGALYVTSVVVAASAHVRHIILLGIVASALTVLGFAVHANSETAWMVVANRLISVAAIALTTLLTVRQKKLTTLLAQQITQLDTKTRELQRYTSIAAHDLREPVRNIQSLVDVLRKRYRTALDKPGAQMLDLIHEGAQRMAHLIGDLLEYSRLGIAVEFKRIDLNTLVSDVLKDLDRTIKASDATVNFTDLPIVHGYEIGLRQLFQNLLSNGLKFCPADRTPVISIWHEDAGHHWLLHIRDNGIGFDPAHTEKAFALFGRLNLRDEYPGTGLGLSICQRVADIHGGTITVQTAVDAGATFTLTLPKTPPAQ